MQKAKIFSITRHALVITITKNMVDAGTSSAANFNSTFLLQMIWFVVRIHENGRILF